MSTDVVVEEDGVRELKPQTVDMRSLMAIIIVDRCRKH